MGWAETGWWGILVVVCRASAGGRPWFLCFGLGASNWILPSVWEWVAARKRKSKQEKHSHSHSKKSEKETQRGKHIGFSEERAY